MQLGAMKKGDVQSKRVKPGKISLHLMIFRLDDLNLFASVFWSLVLSLALNYLLVMLRSISTTIATEIEDLIKQYWSIILCI